MKKLFSTRYSDNAFNFGILLIRLFAGTAMALNHGYDKLIHYQSKLAQGGVGDPFGIGTSASLSLAIFAEFFCAIFVAVGLLTRLVTIPLIVAMSVAFFMAHHARMGEGELAGIYLVIFVALLFVGPGKISVDRLLGK
ncbi:DoxX family protein [Nostoc ellipsosporum NOK]|nr:DoxX family protein [Nostoc ellipsosporum NOK]